MTVNSIFFFFKKYSCAKQRTQKNGTVQLHDFKNLKCLSSTLSKIGLRLINYQINTLDKWNGCTPLTLLRLYFGVQQTEN